MRKLSDLIDVLRGDNGCPWDRVQKPGDILSDLIEEAYELQWAYEEHDREEVLEELGDVVFVLVFALRLIQEEYPDFTLDQITSLTYDKIKRRHPHVFGDAVANTTDEGLAHWNLVKDQENKRKGHGDNLFSKLPGTLSPMRRAEKIQKRAARIGFDWDDTSGILEKIREEIDELESAVNQKSEGLVAAEIGDLFFSVLNLSRFLNIDAEKALVGANAKFIKRFLAMEKLVAEDGRRLDDMNLEEMDGYWDRVKQGE
ncbi:MAG: nucleoside triphosphate pyrophosphohydrolase [Candidatus Krumholzibacteria bacterium]|nr:nucleoside triphosphate pyrophosphohydrolase [Candidatus Krumholzibacteria bacterium]